MSRGPQDGGFFKQSDAEYIQLLPLNFAKEHAHKCVDEFKNARENNVRQTKQKIDRARNNADLISLVYNSMLSYEGNKVIR